MSADAALQRCLQAAVSVVLGLKGFSLSEVFLCMAVVTAASGSTSLLASKGSSNTIFHNPDVLEALASRSHIGHLG